MTSRSVRRIPAVMLPTAVAAGLVAFDLTARSLWVDEGATIVIATEPTGSLWHWIARSGGDMAGYYVVMHLVFRIFGTGILTVRLPAALSMVATVPIAYNIARRLFGRREAMGSALLVAVSFPLVFWAQQARGYSFALLATAASVLCFVIAIQDGGLRWWYGCALLAAVAIYCDLLCVLILPAVGCSLIFCAKDHLPSLGTLAAAGGIIGSLCIPLLVMAAGRGTGGLVWVPPLSLGTSGSIWQFLVSARESQNSPFGPDGVLFVLSLLACAGSLVSLVIVIRREGRSERAWSLGLVTCWFVIPVSITFALAALGAPVAVDRYFLPSVLPFTLLAGYMVAQIRPAPLAWAGCAVLVGLRSGALLPSYGHSIEDWGSAAKFISARDPAPSCLAFFETDGWPPFEYYYKTRRPSEARSAVVLPSDTADPTPYLETISADRFPSVVASCPTLWLVTTHVGGPTTTSYEKDRQSTYLQLLANLQRNYHAVSAQRFTGVSVELLRRS